jgi:hypothetical protein
MITWLTRVSAGALLRQTALSTRLCLPLVCNVLH